jgi:hypothetical protein
MRTFSGVSEDDADASTLHGASDRRGECGSGPAYGVDEGTEELQAEPADRGCPSALVFQVLSTSPCGG